MREKITDNLPPENEEKRIRDSGISRVVTKDPELGKLGLKIFKDIFENKQLFEGSPEREKTEIELSLIRQINERLKPFVERYGGEFIKVRPENIHILDPKKMSKEWWKIFKERFGEGDRGACFTFGQSITMILIRGEDEYCFSEALSHELMHLNSFHSVDVRDRNEEVGFRERRTGMVVISKEGNKAYFQGINEAITEELTVRFARDNFSDFPELREGIDSRKSFAESFGENKPDLANIVIRSFQRKGRLWMYSIGDVKIYERERKYLKDVVASIFEKNRGRFPSEEDVFEIFVRAYFSGKMLELAKLVEDTFGRGAFRKMGEEMAQGINEIPEMSFGKDTAE